MNLKELIERTERLQNRTGYKDKAELLGIKQTVEAVDKTFDIREKQPYDIESWQKLKKLFDLRSK